MLAEAPRRREALSAWARCSGSRGTRSEAPRSAEALDPRTPPKVYARVFHSLLDQGIALAPSAFEIAFLSLAHTRRDIDRLAEGLRAALGRWLRVRLTQAEQES